MPPGAVPRGREARLLAATLVRRTTRRRSSAAGNATAPANRPRRGVGGPSPFGRPLPLLSELLGGLCGFLCHVAGCAELVPQLVGARLGAIGSLFCPISALSGFVRPILRPIRPGFGRLGAKAA